MQRTGLILWVFFFCFGGTFAQENYHWTHYTVEDGLPQNDVMSILQDHKGFMWFATWDGLSRFDGYKFTNYKIRPGDKVNTSGSRIDYISEDPYGYIWLLDYGKNVCRFDPVNEVFVNVLEEEGLELMVQEIVTLSNGSVWLLSRTGGAIRFITDTVTKSFSGRIFSKSEGNLGTDLVYDVIEDREGNEWLLTGNGICRINKEKQNSYDLFFAPKGPEPGTEKNPFFCAYDYGNDIWFGSDEGRVWKYDKKSGLFSLLKLPAVSNILAFHHLRQGERFIATSQNGFMVCNENGDEIRHYSTKSSDSLKSDIIFHSYKDSHGYIWMQQDLNTITCFDGIEKKIFNYEVLNHVYDGSEGQHFMIHEDVNEILWVGGGISYFDRKSKKFTPLEGEKSRMLLPNALHTMYSDRQGNLWMSTRSNGLEKFVFSQGNFHLLQPGDNLKNTTQNVRAIAQDDRDRFWIATKSGKILIYDSHRKFMGFLGPDGKLHTTVAGLSDVGIYTILCGQNGTMWLGTKGKGLIKAAACKREEFCYSFENYEFSNEDLYSLSDNNVYHIYEDHRGRLWIATYGGGINLAESPYSSELRFINYRNYFSGYPMDPCYRVRYITSGPDGKIWVATTYGLIVFDGDFKNPEDINFRHYTYVANDSACLSNNDVHDILITPDRDVYVATFGGGVNKLIAFTEEDGPRFRHFMVEEGLPSDVVFSLLEDDRGNIWMSTENGLSCLNPGKGTFRNYKRTDYAYNLNFSEASRIKSKDGSLFFGNQQGVLYFDPDFLSKSSFVPPLCFTEFRLFNREVTPGEKSILKKPADLAGKIILRHDQNIFSIGFSALDMRYPESVKYAVKLSGFDREWRYINDQRIASYTNIPHGEYVFKVRSTNSDGVWVDNERQLPIIVEPSFWVTKWAYFIYIMAFLCIVSLAGYVLATILKLKHKAEMEHKLSELKLDFFTNVSHELRTPLTLIKGPLEEAIKEGGISQPVKERLAVVKKNSDRMMKLTEQILDFVKIHHRKMRMTVEEVPMADLVQNIMADFRFMAVNENIDFSFSDQSQGAVLWADVDKLEKIIYNLLSNAFKYIESGHQITVTLADTGKFVQLSVSDNGPGIASDMQSKIFERFESDYKGKMSKQPGTGIGLALVKELVEMHHGTINVKSLPGKGTEFLISFPKGLDHYDKDIEVLKVPSSVIPVSISLDGEEGAVIEISKEQEKQVQKKTTTILLVEDNREVRRFIKETLQAKYKVLEAPGGEEGLEETKKYQPDLIISDLMMPGMDGVTFLKEIRENIETSHIPFIILTAKSNLENQIEGFDQGADAYITKPFSTSYLMSRIENLLHQRKQLQQRFNRQQSGSPKIEVEPDLPHVTFMDEEFIARLKKFMEKNMDKSDLLVDDLALEAGVSRSVLFKKLKSLTGLAPIEFIRDMRLLRAAQLIETGQYNVKQIAVMVGITDSRYFSKCFKKKFGVSPMGYKNNHSPLRKNE